MLLLILLYTLFNIIQCTLNNNFNIPIQSKYINFDAMFLTKKKSISWQFFYKFFIYTY